MIEEKYLHAYDFSCGLARVASDQEGVGVKWGFINPSGETVVPFSYTAANDFSEGYAAVCSGDRWGIVAADGMLALKTAYDEISQVSGGIVRLRKGEKWAFAKVKAE